MTPKQKFPAMYHADGTRMADLEQMYQAFKESLCYCSVFPTCADFLSGFVTDMEREAIFVNFENVYYLFKDRYIAEECIGARIGRRDKQ